MTETERLTILYGDPTLAPPEQVPLKAGPLSLIYEGGDLRYIRYGKSEIVRRIYVAVRGGKWETIPMTLSETERSIRSDSFRIVYTARHIDTERGIDFEWTGTLTGTAEGVVTFEMDGVSLSEFASNRTGICVLHPAEVAGIGCTIRHTDERKESGKFPERILPDQPFFDIAEISHEAAPGVVASIGFSGEVFEMEDQRNYLDASYKTYSRPQEWPKPYTIPEGERIHQQVTVSVTGKITPQPEIGNEPVVITAKPHDNPVRFPSIGLTVPDDTTPSEAALDKLNDLMVDFLRVDVDLTTDEGRKLFYQADSLAEELGNELVVGVLNGEQMPDVWLRTDNISDYILLPPTPDAINKAVRAGVGGENDLAVLGGGSRVYFTELNRLRPSHPNLDMLAYAGNPQVHSFDATSIMETPPTIAETIRTARTFSGNGYEEGERLLHIGPLTLARATRPPDARQKGLMGAAWYLGTLAHILTEADPDAAWAHQVTLCDTVGPRGIMDEAGKPYPLCTALDAIIPEDFGGNVLQVTVSDHFRIAAFGRIEEKDVDFFIVNLTPKKQSVVLRGLNWTSYQCDLMDENNPTELVKRQESEGPAETEGEEGIAGFVGGLFRRFLGGGNEEAKAKTPEVALTLGAYAFAHIHGKVAT